MTRRYRTLPTIVGAALGEFASSLSELLADHETAFEDQETRIAELLNAVGRAAATALLGEKDPDGDDVELGGESYWEAVRAEREYICCFGRIRVERGVYRRVRNGSTVCPMELRAGIVESFWTPRAAKLAALAVSDMTPYRASQFFAALGGMQPSRSSFDRLPKTLFQRWEAQRVEFEQAVREADAIPDEAASIAVSIDGVMLPMRHGRKHDKKAQARAKGRPDKGPAGYREAGCGAISYYDREGNRLRTVRFGRMPEPKMATLRATLRNELSHAREQRPDLTVVAVADGDHVLWEFLDSLTPDESVVDFYHAAEHLKRAIDLTDGASAVATQKRFERLRHWLRYKPGGVRKVIRSLCQKKPRRTGQSARDRRGINYFKRHSHRMNYHRLKRRKLPIGSGVVEGTCRWLVSDRMKRTGMRWDTAGGQAILTLRALVHSDRFDSAWRLLADTYREPR